MTIVVSAHMTANLDGREIHPLYSTFWIAHHAEIVARRLLEPHLEPGEEGIGTALTIVHKDMAVVGETVVYHAEVTEVVGRRVRCSWTAKTPRALIAEGTQEQAVLPAEVLKARVAEVNAAHTSAKT